VASQILLSVRGLKVEIPIGGSFFPAVDGVDFDLHAGEALAIVGESGCGKTLTARALVNLLPEGSRLTGSMTYRGRDLLALDEKEWRHIRGREMAMVFQEPAAALDPVQTVGGQILEALTAHAPLSRSEGRRQARRLLEEVSLPDPDRTLSEYPHRLSGGQRQRVCLAIALAGNPSVLIADEPTTALDATIAAEVLELLDRLRRERGLALLLITHDLGVVAGQTQRAIVFYAGRIVEEAPTDDFLRAPLHPYSRGLLACVARRGAGPHERFRTIPGTLPDLAFRPRGACAFAPRCPDRFEPCDQREPELLLVGEAKARCFLYDAKVGPVDDRQSAVESRSP
jgi:oligopeptide/dipeptide ABC transporter ATP-binding protein